MPKSLPEDEFDLEGVADEMLPIFNDILPDVVAMFIERCKDYGDTYKHLGSRGQFSDINRKYWKLKRAIWDGEELKGEQVDEIANDIIAHCLLLRLCQKEGI